MRERYSFPAEALFSSLVGCVHAFTCATSTRDWYEMEAADTAHDFRLIEFIKAEIHGFFELF